MTSISDYGLRHFQTNAEQTAIYPEEARITYPLIGLVGEIGEFANKYKKEIRDGTTFEREDAESELGDILWYVALVASDMGLHLDNVARRNQQKLMDRQQRGTLGGSGDDR